MNDWSFIDIENITRTRRLNKMMKAPKWIRNMSNYRTFFHVCTWFDGGAEHAGILGSDPPASFDKYNLMLRDAGFEFGAQHIEIREHALGTVDTQTGNLGVEMIRFAPFKQ